MTPAGAILTGGQSRRMGRTKATIDIDGVAMTTRVANALRAGGCDDVVLIGGDPDELRSLAIPVVEDLYPGEGPLGGVLTALHHFESDTVSDDAVRDVLIVACDLPAFDAVAVRSVLEAAAANPNADVVVAVTQRLEPMVAVWRPTSIGTIHRLFTSGTRSLHDAIDGLTSVAVPIATGVLLNVNRPDDLPGH